MRRSGMISTVYSSAENLISCTCLACIHCTRIMGTNRMVATGQQYTHLLLRPATESACCHVDMPCQSRSHLAESEHRRSWCCSCAQPHQKLWELCRRTHCLHGNCPSPSSFASTGYGAYRARHNILSMASAEDCDKQQSDAKAQRCSGRSAKFGNEQWRQKPPTWQ